MCAKNITKLEDSADVGTKTSKTRFFNRSTRFEHSFQPSAAYSIPIQFFRLPNFIVWCDESTLDY